MQFKGGVDDDGRPLPQHHHVPREVGSRTAATTTRSRASARSTTSTPEVVAAHPGRSRCAPIARSAAATTRASTCALDAATGEPYILEVNPNPDLADGCAFAQWVRASGRTYEQAIQEIVHYALERGKIQPRRYIGPTDTLLTEYLARRAANK